MTITVMDGSEYFRGLLVLISKDRRITDPERFLMKRIGKALGFEREFCENAIHEILDNAHVATAPPVFSAQELAMKFIRDGLTLAFTDDGAHEHEELWLRSTAEKNGLSAAWFTSEREGAAHRSARPDLRLEVEDLTVEHSPRQRPA